MKICRRIFVLAVMAFVFLTVLPGNAYAAFHTKEIYSYIEVKDHGGNPVTEGSVNVYGPIYNVNEKVTEVEGREWYNLEVRTIQYAFKDGNPRQIRTAMTGDGGNVGFNYTYEFVKFGTSFAAPSPASGSFNTNNGAKTLSFTVDRIDVDLTFALKNASGSAVTSGVTVTLNGKSDNSSPYTFTGLREGTAYSYTVSGNGYNYSGSYTPGRNGQKSRTEEVNIGNQSFESYVRVMVGGQPYGGATVNAGSATFYHESDGYYCAKLPLGNVTISASGGGLTSASVNVNVPTAGIPKANAQVLNLDIKDISFGVNDGNSLSYNQDAVSVYVNGGYPGRYFPEGRYAWTSSNTDVIQVYAFGYSGKEAKLYPLGVGTSTVTVTCSYGNVTKTFSREITVEKGFTSAPTASLTGNDTDVNKQTISITNATDSYGNVTDLKSVTVTATGKDVSGNDISVERTFTDIGTAAQTSLTFDFGAGVYPVGNVTYKLSFASDYYNYLYDYVDGAFTSYRILTKTYYRSLASVGAKITLDKSAFTFNGGKQTPTASVTGVPTGSYTVVSTDTGSITAAGKYQMKATGTGNFKGEISAEYNVKKYTVTVTAQDQSVEYTAPINASAYTHSALPGGNTQYGVSAAVEASGTTLKVKNPQLTGAPAAWVDSIEFQTQDGELTILQSTPVITLDSGYKTAYTYGETPSAPSIAVSKAKESDVKTKWTQNDNVVTTPKDAGTYTFTAYIKESVNTKATESSVEITISPAVLSVSSFTGTKVYDGTGKNVNCTVTFTGLKHGDILTEGTGYTLSNVQLTDSSEGKSYSKGSYPLTASIALKGSAAGNYTLSSAISGTASITARPITDVTVAAIPKATYNREAHMPKITGTYAGMTLEEGKDYNLTYANNVNAGTATVTVTGMGNYSGTRDVSFTIEPKPAELEWVLFSNYNMQEPYVYNGQKRVPTVTAKWGEVTLVAGTDYDITYTKGNTPVSDPIDAGDYMLKVTFKGNYSGENGFPFTILPKTLTVSSVTVAPKTYDGTTNAKIAGMVFSGICGTDEVSFKEAVGTFNYPTVAEASSVSVTNIQLQGAAASNYKVENTTAAATIQPAVAKSVIITTGADLTYTGKQQTQTVRSVVIQVPDSTSAVEGATKDVTVAASGYKVSGNTGTKVGSYTLTVAVENTGNYTIASDATGLTAQWKIKPDTSKTTGKTTPMTTSNVKISDLAAVQSVIDSIEKGEENAAVTFAAELNNHKALKDEIIEAEAEIAKIKVGTTPVREWLSNNNNSNTNPDDLAMRDQVKGIEADIEKITDANLKRMVKESLAGGIKQIKDRLYIYKFIAGHDPVQTFTKSSGKTLTFTANGHYTTDSNAKVKFLKVQVDGRDLASSKYSVKSGSTIVELKYSYLNTLSAGSHTIQLFYTDADAASYQKISGTTVKTDEATFKVQKAATSPKTGDPIMGTVMVMTLSAASLAVLVLSKKKRTR